MPSTAEPVCTRVAPSRARFPDFSEYRFAAAFSSRPASRRSRTPAHQHTSTPAAPYEAACRRARRTRCTWKCWGTREVLRFSSDRATPPYRLWSSEGRRYPRPPQGGRYIERGGHGVHVQRFDHQKIGLGCQPMGQLVQVVTTPAAHLLVQGRDHVLPGRSDAPNLLTPLHDALRLRQPPQSRLDWPRRRLSLEHRVVEGCYDLSEAHVHPDPVPCGRQRRGRIALELSRSIHQSPSRNARLPRRRPTGGRPPRSLIWPSLGSLALSPSGV